MTQEPTLLQGTAVLVGSRAVLLRGPSGAGKSALALALLALDDARRPVRLVADDAVQARRAGAAVLLTPPPPTRGLVEVRGVGLCETPSVERALLALVVDLDAAGERLPEAADCRVTLCGVELPRVVADPLAAAAAHAVMRVLAAVERGHWPPYGVDGAPAAPSGT